MAGSFKIRTGISSREQLLLVLGVLLVGLWGFVAYDLDRTREQLIAESRGELRNLSLAFAKEVEASVKAIDLSLLDLREHWHGNVQEFSRLVRHRQAYMEKDLAFQVAIIDAQGMLIYSSLDMLSKPVDLSDREHFRIHRERSSDELFISKPILGRVSKRWSVQFTRPLYDRQDQFSGVIVLSISPEYFYRFYRAIDLGSDSVISLVRGSGEVLSRYPQPEEALGKTITDVPYLGQFSPTYGFFHKVAQIDGVERIYAWRKLEPQPLVVVVGFGMERILMPYWPQQTRALLAASGLTLLLLLVGFLKWTSMGQQQRLTTALAESEERWRYALDGVGDGVWDWQVQSGKVIFSRAWKAMLGYAEAEIDNNLEEWKHRVHPDDLPGVLADLDDYFLGKTPVYINEHRMRCKDGEWKWILDRGMVIQRDSLERPLRMVGTHIDISARKAMEEMLRNMATTDGLTGLYNRRFFLSRMEEELARLQRGVTLMATVLMVDLDHFKKINDTYGHAAGDAVLRHFSALLNDGLRQTDTAGRLGGEEFALLLAGTDESGGRLFAQRLCEQTAASVVMVEGQAIHFTVSIGIARLLPADGSVEKALQRADGALYEAKHNGRNQYAVATLEPQEARR